jgi:hypothetical protein
MSGLAVARALVDWYAAQLRGVKMRCRRRAAE